MVALAANTVASVEPLNNEHTRDPAFYREVVPILHRVYNMTRVLLDCPLFVLFCQRFFSACIDDVIGVACFLVPEWEVYPTLHACIYDFNRCTILINFIIP